MTAAHTAQTCAVVVTHNPDVTALLKLLGHLERETDFVVIDNGSEAIGKIADSITVYSRCRELFRLGDNEGLARGLNIGIRWALERGYAQVFLFDQDSSLCNLYFRRMVTALAEIEMLCPRPVAAVGPRIINPQTMRQTPFKLFNRLWLRSDRPLAGARNHFQADFLITSGSMLNLRHLGAIGEMKESFFIDNIDLEWCFRAKSRGFVLAGTDAAVLYHAIGERSDNPLVRAGYMAQHNPARTYYSSRNRRYLWHCDYAPLGWKLRDRPRFLFKAGWLLLASPQRREYWHNLRNGMHDAKTLISGQ